MIWTLQRQVPHYAAEENDDDDTDDTDDDDDDTDDEYREECGGGVGEVATSWLRMEHPKTSWSCGVWGRLTTGG